jgi:hypothetical protein
MSYSTNSSTFPTVATSAAIGATTTTSATTNASVSSATTSASNDIPTVLEKRKQPDVLTDEGNMHMQCVSLSSVRETCYSCSFLSILMMFFFIHVVFLVELVKRRKATTLLSSAPVKYDQVTVAPSQTLLNNIQFMEKMAVSFCHQTFFSHQPFARGMFRWWHTQQTRTGGRSKNQRPFAIPISAAQSRALR